MSSTDGNLTILHHPDAGKKLGSCCRPRADRTVKQNRREKFDSVADHRVMLTVVHGCKNRVQQKATEKCNVFGSFLMTDNPFSSLL